MVISYRFVGGALLLTLCLLATPTLGSTDASTPLVPDEVLEFVRRSHYGVEYEEARALGPGAVPILGQFLHREDLKEEWPWVTTTLAMIGTHETFEIIRSFVWDRFRGEVDQSTFVALMSSHSVLGLIDSPDVVPYLERGLDPTTWNSLPWSHPGMSRDMTDKCVSGISYSADPRARAALKRFGLERDGVRVALKRQSIIMERGVAAYVQLLRNSRAENRPLGYVHETYGTTE